MNTELKLAHEERISREKNSSPPGDTGGHQILVPIPGSDGTNIIVDDSLVFSPVDTLNAVSAFVKDLWTIFGNKNVTPLSLYNRLIDHIEPVDKEAMGKMVTGFVEFYNLYSEAIFTDSLKDIPPGTRINYSDGKLAYIPIQMYIHKSPPDAKEAIREHLMTIAYLIQPDRRDDFDKYIKAATPGAVGPSIGIDTTSAEGRFINGIMQKANVSLANVDVTNPMAATMALYQSGIMGDMIAGLKDGTENGEMDIAKLMGMMQTAMSTMMKSDSE